jgi:hypothetical protein
MRVHLAMPDGPVSDRDLRRCASSLRWRFGPVEVVHEDATYRATFWPADEQVVCIEVNAGGLRAKQIQQETGRRTYYFDFSSAFHRAKLVPSDDTYDREEYPELDAHVFSRLSMTGDAVPKTMAQLYPFPHTYLSRSIGLGPLDRFGFRAHPDAGSLAGRAPSHKLVCLFGGSTTWSFECLPEETSAAVLERKLNDWAAATASGLRFTVLNFGIHGTLTMDHLLHYLYFAERLSPEVVIANDGVNELWAGHDNDPLLMREIGLLYHESWEGLARLYHEVWEGLPITSTSGPSNPGSAARPPGQRAVPRDIAAAYVTRKRQFRRLVEGRGTRFVSGLQPILTNKGAHSPTEQNCLAHPGWAANLDVVRVMYQELFRTTGFAELMEGGVDGPAVFGRLDGAVTHFVDIYHLSPEGEEVVGGAYFGVLRDHFSASAAVKRAS